MWALFLSLAKMPLIKGIVAVWATLNAVDDISVLFRVLRLGAAVLPGGSDRTSMCDVCDDVMGDLLKGAEGFEALPCKWACLGVPKCVKMCNNLKEFSQNSSHFPCVAAGYCDDYARDDFDVQCEFAPILRCVPSRLCHRRRSGLKFSCALKPGIGRWIGMQQAMSEHAGALASAGVLRCAPP